MPEDYAAKMALKADAALREYVTGHYQYREEAVLAALDELRARGQPAPEEAALRPGLEAGAAARRTEEAARLAEAPAGPGAPAASASADKEPSGPALYSPTLIILFSIFVNPLVGGILLGLNLQRLRRWKPLIGLAVFTVGYFIVSQLVLRWALLSYGPSTFTWLAPFLNLPAVLAYAFWFWPRYVGKQAFRSRSWLPPLLICLLLGLGAQQLASYLLQKQPPKVREQLEKLLIR